MRDTQFTAYEVRACSTIATYTSETIPFHSSTLAESFEDTRGDNQAAPEQAGTSRKSTSTQVSGLPTLSRPCSSLQTCSWSGVGGAASSMLPGT